MSVQVGVADQGSFSARAVSTKGWRAPPPPPRQALDAASTSYCRRAGITGRVPRSSRPTSPAADRLRARSRAQASGARGRIRSGDSVADRPGRVAIHHRVRVGQRRHRESAPFGPSAPAGGKGDAALVVARASKPQDAKHPRGSGTQGLGMRKLLPFALMQRRKAACFSAWFRGMRSLLLDVAVQPCAPRRAAVPRLCRGAAFGLWP